MNNLPLPLHQIVLIILDGWGYTETDQNNAIALAHPEYFNTLWSSYPHTLFEASGEAVGLLPGNIGTSEIGHLTIGAGRIIDTDVVRIFKSIESGEIKNNHVLNELIGHVTTHSSILHFIGLLSPGSVHSHQEQLFSLMEIANEQGISNIVIHPFLDGRDTPPQSGIDYVKQLQQELDELGVGTIATITGRYYAMDRDNNWDRTDKARDALFLGIGEQKHGSATEILQHYYSENITDEFIPPTVLSSHPIGKNDAVLFFNFRPDRARQITQRLFEQAKERNVYIASMTEYSKDLPTHVLFPPLIQETSLAQEISLAGLTQVHIAETEKYAHVTYFLNGGKELKHPNEEWVLVESRKDIPTHDLAPEMKAAEITDTALKYIENGTNFIVINFANADMVGHSGKMEPTITAIKTIDAQLKRICEAIKQRNGTVFITADHGNAEVMYDEATHQPVTAHSLNPVPGILTLQNIELHPGTLADIAPTLLYLFNITQPETMTGKSLISTNNEKH